MMFNASADRESERQFISPPFAKHQRRQRTFISEVYPSWTSFLQHELVGLRFAPRIRDLADRRLYTAEKALALREFGRIERTLFSRARGHLKAFGNRNGMRNLISDHDYELHLGGTAKLGIQKTLDCRGDLRNLCGRAR